MRKAYGIIQTLSPLHVGATAGEESGNLNLIFRDQFTLTGIIPGSSIRGRLRSQMRHTQSEQEASYWYGNRASSEFSDTTTESRVKIEYASIVWLPVFCPGQPIVWVSCPNLLKRYQRIVGEFIRDGDEKLLKDIYVNWEQKVYTRSRTLRPLRINEQEKLFFNFGFLTIERHDDLSVWFPLGQELPAVIVQDNEIGMIHDMALYRQSRVKLKDDQKVVEGKGFFNTEALPEGTILVFPIGLRVEDKQKPWQPFGPENKENKAEIFLGGLESIGFGHCEITLKGVENYGI